MRNFPKIHFAELVFAKKAKIFTFFASERNAKNAKVLAKKHSSQKMQNFRETIFLFR